MVKSFRYVHHNKCDGGYAIEEVDHNTYCLGRADSYYEDVVLVPECKKCPRLIYNNEDKIDEYIKRKERRTDADD
jgi:hypothetical protein